MQWMNYVKNVFNRSPTTVARCTLVTERGNGFYSWNGKLYQSDIVRSCIRPFYKAVGKLLAKQIREGTELKVNPDAYVKRLLEEPNPYMTGQILQEKLAIQFKLNNNAFALIVRDAFGYAMEMYPIPAIGAEAIYDDEYKLYLKFTLKNGKNAIFPYEDVIHLRQDFYSNDIFGDGNTQVMENMMEVVGTIDQGIIKAIRNSAVIRWLLKYKQTLRPEDIKKYTQEFVKNYLSLDNDDSIGAAATDAKADIEQVKPTDFVPNAVQMDKAVQRIYNYFNTNEKIIQSKFTEDEWNAYFEAEIEPFSKQSSGEYSRKIFSRRERGHGNKIIFEANSLQYASMATKLKLSDMVDRAAMTPNEWRLVLNMGPIEGGDKAIRRLDTAVVNDIKKLINRIEVLLNKGGDSE